MTEYHVYLIDVVSQIREHVDSVLFEEAIEPNAARSYLITFDHYPENIEVEQGRSGI